MGLKSVVFLAWHWLLVLGWIMWLTIDECNRSSKQDRHQARSIRNLKETSFSYCIQLTNEKLSILNITYAASVFTSKCDMVFAGRFITNIWVFGQSFSNRKLQFLSISQEPSQHRVKYARYIQLLNVQGPMWDKCQKPATSVWFRFIEKQPICVGKLFTDG